MTLYLSIYFSDFVLWDRRLLSLVSQLCFLEVEWRRELFCFVRIQKKSSWNLRRHWSRRVTATRNPQIQSSVEWNSVFCTSCRTVLYGPKACCTWYKSYGMKVAIWPGAFSFNAFTRTTNEKKKKERELCTHPGFNTKLKKTTLRENDYAYSCWWTFMRC